MLTFSLIRITNYEQLIDHPEIALKRERDKERERMRKAIYKHGSFQVLKNLLQQYTLLVYNIYFFKKISKLH